jgi:hypothetical protein
LLQELELRQALLIAVYHAQIRRASSIAAYLQRLASMTAAFPSQTQHLAALFHASPGQAQPLASSIAASPGHTRLLRGRPARLRAFAPFAPV